MLAKKQCSSFKSALKKIAVLVKRRHVHSRKNGTVPENQNQSEDTELALFAGMQRKILIHLF